MAGILSELGFRIVADASPYAVFLEFGSIAGEKERFGALAKGKPPHCAALVMNCNPFTLGHRKLIERAAAENPWVWVLVVEEDKSEFSFKDRISLIRDGTEDIPGVQVLSGGEYVISSLTFPAYFTRDAERAAAQGALDAALFAQVIAPALRITRRYVGTEPLSPSTAQYNRALRERLPPEGIELVELPRFEGPEGLISASAVRESLKQGVWDRVRGLDPDTTWSFLIRCQDEIRLKIMG
jgi:[citrate (pro-3S)-lyase] ligase